MKHTRVVEIVSITFISCLLAACGEESGINTFSSPSEPSSQQVRSGTETCSCNGAHTSPEAHISSGGDAPSQHATYVSPIVSDDDSVLEDDGQYHFPAQPDVLFADQSAASVSEDDFFEDDGKYHFPAQPEALFADTDRDVARKVVCRLPGGGRLWQLIDANRAAGGSPSLGRRVLNSNKALSAIPNRYWWVKTTLDTGPKAVWRVVQAPFIGLCPTRESGAVGNHIM